MTVMAGQGYKQTDLCRFFQQRAQYDDAGLYQCAKGVGNLLKAAGLPHTRGDGYTWKDSLPQNGWVKLEGITAANAPPGAVIAYDRDPPSTRKNNGAGSQYGHVEIVAMGEDGKRRFVSDAVRANAGGTVPHNFAGVFWHPSMGPPPTPGADGIYAGTAPSVVLAKHQQQQTGEKKKPGTHPYLDGDAGIVFKKDSADISLGTGFNNASTDNKHSMLMVMLALAVLGSAMTGQKIDLNTTTTSKPLS